MFEYWLEYLFAYRSVVEYETNVFDVSPIIFGCISF